MSLHCRLACNWSDRVSADAFSSQVEKWTVVQPELALALRFADAAARPVVAALACLDHEIAHAATHITERDVALAKLNWWADELAALAAGAPRHPLTQALAGHAPLQEIPVAQWRSTVAAAAAMRDAAPAADLAELLSVYRQYAQCWAAMQRSMHPRMDVDAWAGACALALAFRESLRLDRVLLQDRLPLAMDLLARHQLPRSELMQHAAERDLILREHFSLLAEAMRAVSRSGLSVLAAVLLSADEHRCRKLAKARNVLETGHAMLARLPGSSPWVAWRAARKMQPFA